MGADYSGGERQESCRLDRGTLKARESRIAALEAQVEDYCRQLATALTRAVAKNRELAKRKPWQMARRRPKAPAARLRGTAK